MPTVLYDDGNHKCVAFTTLVEGEGVQANQFAIIYSGEGVLLDPGGNLTYKNLLADMAMYFLPSHTRYVFASHQDPDIVASINGWLLITDAKILIAAEWERFLPHFCSKGMTKGRLIAIPALGMDITLGQTELNIIPAHYLHTVGNFQIYDPVSKILFSGDIGAAIVSGEEAADCWTDFNDFLERGSGYAFHRRYMSGNKACKYWVEMVRQLDLDYMVPQHGPHFKGKQMINMFLDWFEHLECGIDLISQNDFCIR